MKAIVLLLYLLASALPVAWLALRGGRGGESGALVARLVQLCADVGVRQAVLDALLQAGLAAALAVCLAVPAAIALTAWRLGNRRRAARLLWFSRAVPPLLLAAPLAQLAAPLAPHLPTVFAVALAQLVFNLPVAVAIVFVPVSRRSPQLAEEAMQDGLWPWTTWRRVWWPCCRGACVLAFLWCFAASVCDSAIAAALQAQPTLATALPTAAAGLSASAVAALGMLPVALMWSGLLGWWWARTRPWPASA